MYSTIKVHGNMDNNYVWATRGTMTDEEVNAFISSMASNPEWNSNTILLAPFQGNLKADNPSILNSIVGYRIQRKDNNLDSRVEIGTFDGRTTKIKDYSVGNNTTSQYYVIPIFDVNGVETYVEPILSDATRIDYSGLSIVGLLPGEKRNEYIIDKDNVWHFDLNVELDSYILNSDKQFADGFGRFSKSVAGDRMYLSGGVTALMGHVDCKSMYISDDTLRMKSFYRFCHSPSLKLLKDTKGNVLVVDIEPQTQTEIDSKTIQQQTTISFKFREIESIENIIVKGVEG